MRYRAIEGSDSGHCCFRATVIDTAKPGQYGTSFEGGTYERFCECFEMDQAELICAALNHYDESQLAK